MLEVFLGVNKHRKKARSREIFFSRLEKCCRKRWQWGKPPPFCAFPKGYTYQSGYGTSGFIPYQACLGHQMWANNVRPTLKNFPRGLMRTLLQLLKMLFPNDFERRWSLWKYTKTWVTAGPCHMANFWGWLVSFSCCQQQPPRNVQIFGRREASHNSTWFVQWVCVCKAPRCNTYCTYTPGTFLSRQYFPYNVEVVLARPFSDD